jgi:outer membrane immunogenic protein
MEDVRMKRVLLACVAAAAALGLVGQAQAADLGRAPIVKAPPYIAPYQNWTGLYVGVNAGGGWGSSTWSGVAPGSFDVSGGFVGGTLGYNWQIGQIVLGLEGDIDWSDIRGSSGICGFACQTRNNWFGTTRGRIGYAFDRWMPYITGGLAFGDIEANPASPFASASTTNAGWTLGGGVEVALSPNWSAKVEYLHLDLSDFTCTVCAPVPSKVDFNADLVRGGLNYKF